MAILISFDIDGTMEIGDPPGPVTLKMVKAARAKGIITGSCSDRPMSAQRAIWEEYGIEYDFVTSTFYQILKTNLKLESTFMLGTGTI